MQLDLCVIFGGKSVEHEISVITALQAMRSLNKSKYFIHPLYITKEGDFYTGEALLAIENFRDIPGLLKNCRQAELVSSNGEAFIMTQKGKIFTKPCLQHVDVCLPAVHGTNCEDGTLQGFLQLLGVPYCGCNVAASAIGMDKVAAKTILAANGIPVLPQISFSFEEYADSPENTIARAEQNLPYPMIVKPVNLGSSVGVKAASDKAALAKAIEDCGKYSEKIMIEPAVQNLREINCAVLGDEYEAQASPCEEPLGTDEVLSYADKYMSGGKSGKSGMSSQKRRLPADISPEMTEKIQKLALASFKALGCSGVARVDFLTDAKTGDIYVNEINTIPGSLSYYLWEAAGKRYSVLLDELVDLALKRARREKNINRSFDTGILSGFTFGGTKGKA